MTVTRQQHASSLDAPAASGTARSVEIENVDRLCAMAAALLEVPFVTVVWGADGARSQQHSWVREDSEHPAHLEVIRLLCSNTVLGAVPVTIDDIHLSPVFSALLTARASTIRACAGVPLMTPADQLIGHLFAMDLVTRPWTERELSVLTTVCRLVALAIKLADGASESDHRADAFSNKFEAQEDLLAEIAHDLRQPLALISNCGELLAREDLPQRHRHGETLRKGVRTMSTLIDEMLTAKPSASLELRHMDPVSMVREAVHHLMPLAARHGLSIEGSVEEGLPAIHCDLVKVERVYSNLIGNAIKFAAPSSTIRLSGRRVAEGVQFSVSNNGLDIFAPDVSKVFERRWQATQEGEGRGLGLAIVKKLVEAHGGSVGVRSEAGTTAFWFTLPV
ncbi:MAG: GAF domain-containing sensor histidine kinase [Panacagrimonas sp.]